jgi:hypothetical protein
MLRRIKGQSTTELAVLGSLILMVFSFLINYSEKLNKQQSYIQQAFRAALKEARNANSFASYTKVAYRRLPNVSVPMELGQLQTFSGSANVLWLNRIIEDENDHGVSKYQLNEDEAIDIPHRDTPKPGTVEVSENEFINRAVSDIVFTKRDGPGGVVTFKSLEAEDTLTADIDISGNRYTFTHTLGEEGKYYPGEHVLIREKEMR